MDQFRKEKVNGVDWKYYSRGFKVSRVKLTATKL